MPNPLDALKKATGIRAASEPSLSRKVLETFTGYPADPTRDMTPLDALQMLTMGLGATKGVSKLAGPTYKRFLGPNANPMDAIKHDPYALAEGPTGRRQFIDRLVGNPPKRLQKDLRTAGDQVEAIRTKYETAGPWPQNPFGWRSTEKGGIRRYGPGEKEIVNKWDNLSEIDWLKQANRMELEDFATEGTPGPVAEILSQLRQRTGIAKKPKQLQTPWMYP